MGIYAVIWTTRMVLNVRDTAHTLCPAGELSP